ncbi:MAG: YheT family hydrolase [Longimicrobiales bacterium]
MRERIDTPDGDFIDLDFPPPPSGADETSPLVLLLHGLEGSARRGYAINVYRALAAHGVRAVGLNFRSCSGEINRTARFYHSGDTDDIRHVVATLRARYAAAPLGIIGFSLGGNALLKYLGEEAGEARGVVSCAVGVSVPYDLAAGADALDTTPMGRFYTGVFLKSLVAKADAKAALLVDRCDIERVRAARSFRDFDDAATAPLHGFAGAEDYYTRSSSKLYLERVRVPTLLLHAADDPFLPARAFPHAEVAANPCLTAAITSRGGHVGFISGPPWRPRFWAEQTAADWFAGKLVERRGTSIP